MASTEQILELVVVDTLSNHLLSAVASRLARQQGFDVDTKVVVRSNIQCQGEERAVDISSLMQNCRSVEVRGNLQVSKDIGKEGWAALREAMEEVEEFKAKVDFSFKKYQNTFSFSNMVMNL